jgi:hypothetical protein
MDVLGVNVLESFQKMNFFEEKYGIEVAHYDHLIDYHAFKGTWSDEVGGLICETGDVVTILDPVIAYREGILNDVELESCQKGGWSVAVTLSDNVVLDMTRIGFVLPENVTVLKGAL